MTIFLFVIVLILMVYSLCIRCMILNPIDTIRYFIVDTYRFFRYKGWLKAPTGKIIAFTGLFGKGKTLSLVHHVRFLYARFNNTSVWCTRRKKWVHQVVKVYSNVDLDIPFLPFTEMKQMVNVAQKQRQIDDENDTLTISYFVGDEFSVQMNSRSFKTNISAPVLNTTLTCRHHNMSLFVSSQRFGHMDALFRQVTSYVAEQSKVWRFQCMALYDAWDLENSTNVKLIKPIKRKVWFIKDSDYNAYDTYQIVDELGKKCENGDMLTDEEILALQSPIQSDMDAVNRQSKKYKKRQKR